MTLYSRGVMVDSAGSVTSGSVTGTVVSGTEGSVGTVVVGTASVVVAGLSFWPQAARPSIMTMQSSSAISFFICYSPFFFLPDAIIPWISEMYRFDL